ncbi:MAG: 4,5-DOPA dioxygenase extradiol [Candidatus Peregrinibacteria bacterium]
MFDASPKLNTTPEMPVLFIGHGNPMNAIEENPFVEEWRKIGKTIPKPAAILCISAHWETRGTFVTAMQNPKTIHDFGGFPEELFAVKYPAPGSEELAKEIQKIITKTTVELDEKWGLDHGCWSVLKVLYPEANIPVVQLSLDSTKPAQYHYELAKELAPLRQKGVLIMGSGNIVHNLGMLDWDKMSEPEFGQTWAQEANTQMKEWILSNNHQSIIHATQQGRAFQLAIPTPEHFLPLLYALALKKEEEEITIFNDTLIMGSLSMTSLKIGK